MSEDKANEMAQERELVKLRAVRLAIAECLKKNQAAITKRAAELLAEAGIEVSIAELENTTGK